MRSRWRFASGRGTACHRTRAAGSPPPRGGARSTGCAGTLLRVTYGGRLGADGVICGGDDCWGLRGGGARRQGGHVEVRKRPSRLCWRGDREGRAWCLEAPMPTVSHVLRVVEAQLRAGWLRCLVPGCGGVLAPWWFGVPREIIGLG